MHSLEERIALLEKQSNLKRQAFEYLTQLRLTSLTLQYEVGEGGALAEWTSDCEAADGKSIGELSDDEFDPSASEYDYDDDEFDDDSIPSSSAPAEEKPVSPAEEKPVSPAAGEGAGFSGPEYDPECGSSMIPLAHWAKLAAAISRLGGVLRT